MVKIRDPKSEQKVTSSKIEAFVSSVDGGKTETDPEMDPRSKRKYKGVGIPFNKYEFNMLEEAAFKTGRSKLGFIRWAIATMAKEVLEKD